ncbi:MAG: hypothetical protein ACKVZ0_25415 [Gemmatimonadales bacterium]
MDPIALARAADENLATHFTWIQSHTPGMRVERAADLLVTISGLPSDNFNAACGARIDPDQADRRVPEWLRWLERNAAPFAWWVGITDQPADLGQRLLAAGLRLSEREIDMAVNLSGHRSTGSEAESSRGAAVSSADLTIRRARTRAAIADFATVTMTNYAPRDPSVETFYARATDALLTDEAPCWCYVGYLDEVPVACLQVTWAEAWPASTTWRRWRPIVARAMPPR